MTLESSILYLGSDPEFIQELNAFCKVAKKSEVAQSVYQRGAILELALSNDLKIIFIDLTETDLNFPDLIAEVAFAKRYPPLKKILFVALLADQEDQGKSDLLLSAGFQYIFIKGCDSEILFKDCFYIQLGRDKPSYDFAMARDIFKPITGAFNSSLTALRRESFLVETDLQSTNSILLLSLSIFPDLTETKFKIKETLGNTIQYPMTYTHILDYPIASAWDDFSEVFIMPDTIDTWLTLNQPSTKPMSSGVQVISCNHKLVRDLHLINSSFPFYVTVTDDIVQEQLSQSSAGLSTDLIFIDYDDDVDSKLGIEGSLALISQLKSNSLKPFLIISNTKSTSLALQKLFQYEQILATKDKLTAEIVQGLSHKFNCKKKDSASSPYLFLVPSDVRRPIDIFYNFTLTSLSEHEMTFFCDVEIPMFSVLHFEYPLNFYATLVPAYRSLNKRTDQYHYLALLNGMSEEQLQYLRQFINQIIHTPLKDYSQENLSSIMKEIYNNRASLKPDTPKVSADIIEQTVEVKADVEEIKIKKIIGKSKL